MTTQKTLSDVMPSEALLGLGISEEDLNAEVEVAFREEDTTYVVWGNSSAMLIIPDHGQSGWTQDLETVGDVVARASGLGQYEVTIDYGGVCNTEHVTAESPDAAIDIVEEQVLAAAARGDYSCEGVPVEAGTFLSRLECDGITRRAYA